MISFTLSPIDVRLLDPVDELRNIRSHRHQRRHSAYGSARDRNAMEGDALADDEEENTISTADGECADRSLLL